MNVQRAHVERPDLARDATTAHDWDRLPSGEPYPTAIEQRRGIAATEDTSAAGAADVAEATLRKLEDAAPLEKELALLGEEQAEAGQVDLLLVDLDLGKVGVVREVRGEVPRERVLRVNAGIPVTRAAHRRLRHEIGGRTPNAIGLDLETPRALRHLEPNERPGRRHAEDAAASANPAAEIGIAVR